MDKKHEISHALDILIALLDENWRCIHINACGLWVNKGWDSNFIQSKAFEMTYLVDGSAMIKLDKVIN